MKVAKLTTGQLVRFLKGPQSVPFAAGEHVLISPVLSENPSRIRPQWILSTYVLGVLDLGETK